MDTTPAGLKLIALSKPLPWKLTAASDAALAAYVTTFSGDINVGFEMNGLYTRPLLAYVVQCPYPTRTLAALAARTDVNLYTEDCCGFAPVVYAMSGLSLRTFLETFPAFDVDATCSRRGCKPLGVALGRLRTYDAIRQHTNQAVVQLLLDVGATVSDAMWGVDSPWHDKFSPSEEALIAPHRAWAGLRRTWVVSSVAIATGVAKSIDVSLLSAMISAVEPDQFQISNEYAGMVALFL